MIVSGSERFLHRDHKDLEGEVDSRARLMAHSLLELIKGWEPLVLITRVSYMFNSLDDQQDLHNCFERISGSRKDAKSVGQVGLSFVSSFSQISHRSLSSLSGLFRQRLIEVRLIINDQSFTRRWTDGFRTLKSIGQ